MNIGFPSLTDRIKWTLAEDAPDGDITTQLMAPESVEVSATLVSKAEGVFFGEDIIQTVFEVVNPGIKPVVAITDGTTVASGAQIATMTGPASDILLAERTMLNLLQRVSGVASMTRRLVAALADPAIKVLDTRKTTPLWRDLEKKAVLAGGGHNHRYGLSDMVLIKENHLASLAAGPGLDKLGGILAGFKRHTPHISVQVEVTSVAQLHSLDLSHADMVLLDNFSLPQVEEAVTLKRGHGWQFEIEVSGNVTLDTIAQYRGSGINRISVGSLTHSVPALDLSLLI